MISNQLSSVVKQRLRQHYVFDELQFSAIDNTPVHVILVSKFSFLTVLNNAKKEIEGWKIKEEENIGIELLTYYYFKKSRGQYEE